VSLLKFWFAMSWSPPEGKEVAEETHKSFPRDFVCRNEHGARCSKIQYLVWISHHLSELAHQAGISLRSHSSFKSRSPQVGARPPIFHPSSSKHSNHHTTHNWANGRAKQLAWVTHTQTQHYRTSLALKKWIPETERSLAGEKSSLAQETWFTPSDRQVTKTGLPGVLSRMFNMIPASN
jgi:hypothetical protein